MAIKEILLSEDPLSKEALQLLINHREEDEYVDYKESVEIGNNKQWYELTKDVMAFANTKGGYIVFGVKYKPFVVTGLDASTVEFLVDANNILQKVNRYVGPAFTNLRTKKYQTADGTIVALYIPESKGRTHIVIKEATYKYPTGKTDTILRPGMIYVRRTATNQILTPDELEFILSNRLDYYKESIFNKISKVIEAPIEKELVFMDSKDLKNEAKKIKLSKDKDAISIKGLNITSPPQNDQEEISGWIALRARDKSFSPSPERLWYIYSKRVVLKDTLREDQIAELMRFNLLNEIPTFYWIQYIDNEKSKKIMKECFESVKEFDKKSYVLRVGAFKGKTFFNSLLKKMGDDAKRLNPRSSTYPHDPCSLFHPEFIKKEGKGIKAKNASDKFLEERLDYLASQFSNTPGNYFERWEAEATDCCLYTRVNVNKK